MRGGRITLREEVAGMMAMVWIVICGACNFYKNDGGDDGGGGDFFNVIMISV